MDQRRAVDGGLEIVLKPLLEVEGRFLRHIVAVQKLRIALPADLDAAEEISLGARHLEDAQRIERRLGAENFRVRLEADLGAAAVVDLAEFLQAALRFAAHESLCVELAATGDLDLHALGQRIGDRHADAMQAARGAVDLGIELPARVQRRHDHFERGLVLELRMRIDRDAAAVVGHGDKAIGFHLDLDEIGMAFERLVHGVVDHLGEQVMQRLLVGAADIHAGAPAHRLEPLQHLDMARGIASLGAARRAGASSSGFAPPGRAARRRVEQVAGGGFFRCFCHIRKFPASKQINPLNYATAVAQS